MPDCRLCTGCMPCMRRWLGRLLLLPAAGMLASVCIRPPPPFRALHTNAQATRSILWCQQRPYSFTTQLLHHNCRCYAGLGTVDIDDVAAAHCLAMAQPEAQGRYVLWERACLMTEVAAMLRCVGFGWSVAAGRDLHGARLRCTCVNSGVGAPPATEPIATFQMRITTCAGRSSLSFALQLFVQDCTRAPVMFRMCPTCAGRSFQITGCRRCRPRCGCPSPCSSCRAPSSAPLLLVCSASAGLLLHGFWDSYVQEHTPTWPQHCSYNWIQRCR